jgi:hypothetical protein
MGKCLLDGCRIEKLRGFSLGFAGNLIDKESVGMFVMENKELSGTELKVQL